jgi:hypothetical protein
MTDELPFRVLRSNRYDEPLAQAVNLLIARGAYREAARLYPEDLIELRQRARHREEQAINLKASPRCQSSTCRPGRAE